jgi:hypothetical protein
MKLPLFNNAQPKKIITMKIPPIPVVIVAVLFIIAGCAGLIYHANEYFGQPGFKPEIILAIVIRVLAIVCGWLLIKRVDWARWLALAWLVYHVILSLFHSSAETITHLLFLIGVTILLFLPTSTRFFKSKK